MAKKAYQPKLPHRSFTSPRSPWTPTWQFPQRLGGGFFAPRPVPTSLGTYGPWELPLPFNQPMFEELPFGERFPTGTPAPTGGFPRLGPTSNPIRPSALSNYGNVTGATPSPLGRAVSEVDLPSWEGKLPGSPGTVPFETPSWKPTTTSKPNIISRAKSIGARGAKGIGGYLGLGSPFTAGLTLSPIMAALLSDPYSREAVRMSKGGFGTAIPSRASNVKDRRDVNLPLVTNVDMSSLPPGSGTPYRPTGEPPPGMLPEMLDVFNTRPGAKISNRADVNLPVDTGVSSIEADIARELGLPIPVGSGTTSGGTTPPRVRPPRIGMGGGRNRTLANAFSSRTNTPTSMPGELLPIPSAPTIPDVTALDSRSLPSMSSPFADVSGIDPKTLPDFLGGKESLFPDTQDSAPRNSVFDMYRDLVSNMPDAQAIKPSIWRKIAASLVGASEGYFKGAGQGYESARDVVDQPYNRAMGEWKTKLDELEPLMKQEMYGDVQAEKADIARARLERDKARDEMINETKTEENRIRKLIAEGKIANEAEANRLRRILADANRFFRTGQLELGWARLDEVREHNDVMEGIASTRAAAYSNKVNEDIVNAQAKRFNIPAKVAWAIAGDAVDPEDFARKMNSFYQTFTGGVKPPVKK